MKLPKIQKKKKFKKVKLKLGEVHEKSPAKYRIRDTTGKMRYVVGYEVSLKSPYSFLHLFKHESLGPMKNSLPVTISEATTGYRVGNGKTLSGAIAKFQDKINRAEMSIQSLLRIVEESGDDKIISYNERR